jgi:FkbM family methyltransferase
MIASEMNIPGTNRWVPLGWAVQPIITPIQQWLDVPILSGPAKGLRWISESSSLNFWLGNFERRKMEGFARELRPNSIVYDIGAHVGIYSLIACRSSMAVFSFEPHVANLCYLRRHLELNSFANCTVVSKAVSDTNGTAKFDSGHDRSEGRISEDGELEVQSISLDSFCEEGNPSPDVIKMDIEGAEYDALCGARKILVHKKPTLFLATHGLKVHRACCELLSALEYDIELLESNELIARARLTPISPIPPRQY